jgi:enoyl-CoA hydratase/carnithine racemase
MKMATSGSAGDRFDQSRSPHRTVESGLEAFFDDLRGKSGAVLRIAVKGLRGLSLRSFSDDLRRSEAIYCNELLPTRDAAEGIQAYLEKREPHWLHRCQ